MRYTTAARRSQTAERIQKCDCTCGTGNQRWASEKEYTRSNSFIRRLRGTSFAIPRFRCRLPRRRLPNTAHPLPIQVFPLSEHQKRRRQNCSLTLNDGVQRLINCFPKETANAIAQMMDTPCNRACHGNFPKLLCENTVVLRTAFGCVDRHGSTVDSL